MTSKVSQSLADNEKQKNKKQVINRNISELWSGYKNFKAKFHAHNAKLEQFTLKVLKLSFFSNCRFKKISNCLKNRNEKSRKVNIKGQLALIKKVLSIHLRSLQIEQRLFQENQLLKELLNNSYKIVVNDKYSTAIQIYKIKNVKDEEKSFKSGLEYIFHELEAVSNKTKLKRRSSSILDEENFEYPAARRLSRQVLGSTDIDLSTRKSEKLHLQPSKLYLDVTDISQVVKNNQNSILESISNEVSLNSLIFDVKPIRAEAVIGIDDTRAKQEVESANVRSLEKASLFRIHYINSWKNIITLLPNSSIFNYIGLFCPLSLLFKKSINQKPHTSNNIKFEIDSLTKSEEEGENLSKDVREESLNLSEIKTVEFYDIPSNSDIHDYSVSWVEQRDESDFYYLKESEKMLNNTYTNGQPKKRQSIMKRSVYSSRQDNFKDYLKNIITYSEEFYSKRDSSSTINPSIAKKRKQLINFPPSRSAESNIAGKYKMKNILEHNANYSNYKLPKMPDMNKTYQIVLQQNMPQGYSLKFVKSKEKDVSTLIVSNRYPTKMPIIPNAKLYKK